MNLDAYSIDAELSTLGNKFNSFQPLCKICLDFNPKLSGVEKISSTLVIMSDFWFFWKTSWNSVEIQTWIFWILIIHSLKPIVNRIDGAKFDKTETELKQISQSSCSTITQFYWKRNHKRLRDYSKIAQCLIWVFVYILHNGENFTFKRKS